MLEPPAAFYPREITRETVQARALKRTKPKAAELKAPLGNSRPQSVNFKRYRGSIVWWKLGCCKPEIICDIRDTVRRANTRLRERERMPPDVNVTTAVFPTFGVGAQRDTSCLVGVWHDKKKGAVIFTVLKFKKLYIRQHGTRGKKV